MKALLVVIDENGRRDVHGVHQAYLVTSHSS
jgi:hypothetical protein